ncbi:DNA-binding response regulator [Erysipelotrichaceae bacterium OH741_COT-311]|nr:DNA-binding response regulator [Erysipelotrichaceae bacterium OH741_COT-311]
MKKTRVMIVDDQYVPRELFRMYVEYSERYELAVVISSAAFALAYLLDENVDLIIMDILMNDGSNGLDVAYRIKQTYPKIKIIAVTSMFEESWVKKAKKIGIDSFWYKEAEKETILSIMDQTMEGKHVYPTYKPKIKLGYIDSGKLTEREMEVLRAMTAGATNTQIALKLNMKENTVKTHIKHMMEKTGCENRTQLAIRARVAGIVVDKE